MYVSISTCSVYDSMEYMHYYILYPALFALPLNSEYLKIME